MLFMKTMSTAKINLRDEDIMRNAIKKISDKRLTDHLRSLRFCMEEYIKYNNLIETCPKSRLDDYIYMRNMSVHHVILDIYFFSELVYRITGNKLSCTEKIKMPTLWKSDITEEYDAVMTYSRIFTRKYSELKKIA